jgi:hypothetical protein
VKILSTIIGVALLMGAQAAGAQTTYFVDLTVDPVSDNYTYLVAPRPETVVGSITLEAGAHGPIQPDEVLSYEFNSVRGDPIHFSMSGTSSGVSCLVLCSLAATNGGLRTFLSPAPPDSSGSPQAMFFASAPLGVGARPGAVMYIGFATNRGDEQGGAEALPGVDIATELSGPASPYNFSLPTHAMIGRDPPGRGSARSVPEFDSTFAVYGLALLGGLVMVVRGPRAPVMPT